MTTLPDFESIRLLSNNVPLDDFCGLTPNEVHHLLYDTYGDKSPLQFLNNLDDSTLDQIPFFRLTEELLKIVKRDAFIKLTPLGALNRKVLHELYDHRLILDRFIESGIFKLSREHDSYSLTTVHIIAKLAGAIRSSRGRLLLTKKGTKFLQPEHRVDFFKETLRAFTDEFNWPFHDRYPENPIVQLGWGYTVYLLDKFGETERTVEFYADKYLRAFPNLLSFFPEHQFSTPQEDFMNCYQVRTFGRFLEWFGFVKMQHSKIFLDRHHDKVIRTDVMCKVFRVD